MKINIFRGDLTDISAKKEALVSSDFVLAETSVKSPQKWLTYTVDVIIHRINYPKIIPLILKSNHWQCLTKRKFKCLQELNCSTVLVSAVRMYPFTTLPHPHVHWQLQEVLGNYLLIQRNCIPQGSAEHSFDQSVSCLILVEVTICTLAKVD